MYFINWNDSFYLPFIKKHYGRFCQKIVMYDNYSDDDSVEIAKSLGIEVRFFGIPGELNDMHYLNVKNHCWKEERGASDYVIVCDADEFLFFGSLARSCPKVIGYNMISDSLPVDDISEITTGYRDIDFDKQMIFDPNKIDEINYWAGCHKNVKSGKIETEGTMYLLHMRHIGGVERLLERHRLYAKRMSKFNRESGAGHQYLHEEDKKRKDWTAWASMAVEVNLPILKI